jgi:hypothetical protein
MQVWGGGVIRIIFVFSAWGKKEIYIYVCFSQEPFHFQYIDKQQSSLFSCTMTPTYEFSWLVWFSWFQDRKELTPKEHFLCDLFHVPYLRIRSTYSVLIKSKSPWMGTRNISYMICVPCSLHRSLENDNLVYISGTVPPRGNLLKAKFLAWLQGTFLIFYVFHVPSTVPWKMTIKWISQELFHLEETY